MSTAKARLIAHTAAQTTENLTAGMLMLDGKSTGPGYVGLAREEVITLHAIMDVLIARFPEADAQIDRWMEDESEAGIQFIMDHSYADLIALAIDQTR